MILECLTIEQQARIAQGKCPDCDGQLVEGPRESGAATIKCQLCGAVFPGLVIHASKGRMLVVPSAWLKNSKPIVTAA